MVWVILFAKQIHRNKRTNVWASRGEKQVSMNWKIGIYIPTLLIPCINN